jgi:hypothetical protein
MIDSIALPINPLKLQFNQDHGQIEKAYNLFFFKNNLKYFRLYHVLGLFFFQVFVFIDLMTVPDNLAMFLTIRFGVVGPLLCIAIALSYLPCYRHIYNQTMAFLVLLASGGYITMGVFVPPAFHFVYFIGFLTCLVFGYALLRLPVWIASTIGWSAGAVYCFVQFTLGELDRTALQAYTAFLIAFEFLFMLICYKLERACRKNFYLLYLMSADNGTAPKRDGAPTGMAESQPDACRQSTEASKSADPLSAMFPICASCKKIRDDNGKWVQVETYVSAHCGAQFSHTICPECKDRLYPELKGDIDGPTDG